MPLYSMRSTRWPKGVRQRIHAGDLRHWRRAASQGAHAATHGKTRTPLPTRPPSQRSHQTARPTRQACSGPGGDTCSLRAARPRWFLITPARTHLALRAWGAGYALSNFKDTSSSNNKTGYVPTWSSHNNSHAMSTGGVPSPANSAKRRCRDAIRLLAISATDPPSFRRVPRRDL